MNGRHAIARLGDRANVDELDLVCAPLVDDGVHEVLGPAKVDLHSPLRVVICLRRDKRGNVKDHVTGGNGLVNGRAVVEVSPDHANVVQALQRRKLLLVLLGPAGEKNDLVGGQVVDHALQGLVPHAARGTGDQHPP